MSADEVRSLLGNPHQVNGCDQRRVHLVYYLDSIENPTGSVVIFPRSRWKVSHTGGS